MSLRRMMLFTLRVTIKNLVLAFKTRVLADLGLFEAETCLETQLTQLDNQGLLDSASLIVTPNGYEENKLYSVLPSNTNGDMSVVKATRATRVNSEGLIENVPYNIFIRSEEFENATWTKSNYTIIQNTQTSPIGNLTADTLRIGVDASSVRHRCYQQQLIFAANTTYTTSYYLKKANHRWIQLVYVSADFGINSWANFDLENGVIGNIGPSTIATITDVGNGWYRCVLQGTTTVGGNQTGCEILTTNNTDSGRYLSYQSTVAEDVCYVWGAQLVLGTVPKTYLPVSTGFNITRIDYSNGICPSILVEPQRTNLLLQSEDFTNGWTLEGTAITSNTQTAPNGLPSADVLSELVINDVHRTYRSAITVTTNTLYTSSFFVKKNNIRYVRLVLSQNGSTTIWAGAQFDLDTQTFTSQVGIGGGVFTSAIISPFADGWFRISVVGSIPSTSMFPMLVLSNGTTMLNTDTRGCPVYLGNASNSLYVWGGQLELGSNLTSYIPTIASTITRNSDVISNTNASTLIGQTEGTIYLDFYYKTSNIDFIIFISESLTNYLCRARIGSTGVNNFDIAYISTGMVGAGAFTNSVTLVPNTRNKIAVTYNSVTQRTRLFCNGLFISEKVILTAFPINQNKIDIGITNSSTVKEINNVSLWKTQLTDTQAINITTL